MDVVVPFTVLIPRDDARFLSVSIATRKTPPPPTRARVPSPGGKRGRGTGRGGKPCAPKLIQLFKPTGKRAEFMQYIGSRDGKITDVLKKFGMTRANFGSFLTNINRVHGVGYEIDSGFVTFILPPGSDWRNIGLL